MFTYIYIQYMHVAYPITVFDVAHSITVFDVAYPI